MLGKKSLLVVVSMLMVIGLLAGCSTSNSKNEGALKGDLVVSGDTLLSHVCVAQSRYYPGDRIVFRALVTDSSDQSLVEDAKVKLVFDNGEEMEMLLGIHGEEIQPNLYLRPQLTYLNDHPGTAIPTLRTYFEITE
ncbi:hypothetical protein ACFSTH_12385 [Paenibacillus yanchengensis]|uniref:DUF3221 domain-containing protein n=1 Tax=Paenibacillus yanchengensis TaxID=2035833 RepID=A0ABW4YN70_9BACL